MKTITYNETKWQLVPVEPDDAMCSAARSAPIPSVMLDSLAARHALEFRTAYKAALAAAPEPPAQQGGA